MNKDLLISFLNALLMGREREIKDIQYINSEHLGEGYGDRRAVFDVYCELDGGGKIIVEMQKAIQRYFKDRSLYYATVPIREQAPKGEWNYRLEDVYSVGILDFMFPEGEYDDNSYRHEVKLMDVVDKHIFYDKLTFVYLEMPKFNKTEDQLESMFDKWMFALKNLYRLLDRPQALQDRIFTKLFEQAEIAQYTPEERREYETSIKDYRDYINTLDTAEQTGFANGRIAERIDIAKNLKAMGMSAEQIAKGTGLTLSEINKL